MRKSLIILGLIYLIVPAVMSGDVQAGIIQDAPSVLKLSGKACSVNIERQGSGGAETLTLELPLKDKSLKYVLPMAEFTSLNADVHVGKDIQRFIPVQDGLLELGATILPIFNGGPHPYIVASKLAVFFSQIKNGKREKANLNLEFQTTGLDKSSAKLKSIAVLDENGVIIDSCPVK